MRISDWSADVCSSDLQGGWTSSEVHAATEAEPGAVRFHDHGEIGFAGRFVIDAVGGKLLHRAGQAAIDRSEERRVGKESVSTCRSRGSPDNKKKKKKYQKE